jgi:fructoselysine-6-P-deglycase FrlB-like protein
VVTSIDKPMLADIFRQPASLTVLLGRTTEFQAASAAITPELGGRVILFGCGDGLFAAQAAAHHAASRGQPWHAWPALEALLAAPMLGPSDRAIAISMSGNVDRTVQAAEACAARGVKLLAVVNGTGGRVGAIASRRISLDLPDLAPFLCGTASYTSTLAALMLLAEPDGAHLAATLSAVSLALDTPLPLLSPPSGIRMLSAGANAATAAYGAAKLVELTRIPVWHGDIEEFAHSQFWAMPTSDLVVLVAPDPALAPLASGTAAVLAELGVITLAIDAEDAPVATAHHRVTLAAGASPLAAAVPVQRLAYALAEATGLDPNTRLHLRADAARFRASRLLTRRSLVGTGA